MAKGIASGMPLSGIMARRSLIDRFPPGAHGGTYGGNAVACAAALATLDVIEDEGLVANARVRGDAAARRVCECIAGQANDRQRAWGRLMVALEFVKPAVGDGRTPDPDLAKRVLAEALRRKLILLSAGTWGQVVRIIPPLVTTPEEVDHALGILDRERWPPRGPEHATNRHGGPMTRGTPTDTSTQHAVGPDEPPHGRRRR